MATLRVFIGAALLLSCVIGGGGQTASRRKPTPISDIALPAGYRIELGAEGLNFPSGVTFDDQGVPYIVEAGYSYDEVLTKPRLLRVERGQIRVNDRARTGAYMPFGKPSTPGQTVEGQLPCSGAVFKTDLKSIQPNTNNRPYELVAWGFRSPYGFAVSNAGDLYVTENGFDERGSRPIFEAGDVL